MLGLFGKSLTAKYKYSCHNRENLPQQIQIQLSPKPKICALFFIAFMNSTSNFEYFKKKYQSDSLITFEIIDFEGGGYLNV